MQRRSTAYLAPDQETELVSSLALVAERGTAGTVIRRPRIGLFRPSGGSIDEGWTRWVLEQYGFEYVTLGPADFKTPLADRVDVVVLADDARVPIEHGGRGGTRGGVRAEYADRLSATDLASFDHFIRGGGTLVCLNKASN